MGQQARQGFVIYHEDLAFYLEKLNGEQLKSLLSAALCVSQGDTPETVMDPLTEMAFFQMSQKIERDRKRLENNQDGDTRRQEIARNAAAARWKNNAKDADACDSNANAYASDANASPSNANAYASDANASEAYAMQCNADAEQCSLARVELGTEYETENESLKREGKGSGELKGARMRAGSPENMPVPEQQEDAKQKYGKHRNVLLTVKELQTLQEQRPRDWPEWIEKLGSYMKRSGKKYADHFETIQDWISKDESDLNYADGDPFAGQGRRKR